MDNTTETTETRCHCGAEFDGSDHCPMCYCEQFEATCDGRVEIVNAHIPESTGRCLVVEDHEHRWFMDECMNCGAERRLVFPAAA